MLDFLAVPMTSDRGDGATKCDNADCEQGAMASILVPALYDVVCLVGFS